MKEKRYRVVTLGCRTNQYESQAYADQLEKAGYRMATGRESPDISIVNTCAVTRSADRRSLHRVRELARASPGLLVVTGCATGHLSEISSLPGVVQVVQNAEKEHLLEKVFPGEKWPEFKVTCFRAHTRAFVKVQDGCNAYCSYCIIPFVRGASRSRKVGDIVAEIEELVSRGYREVVLTGIDIGSFDGAENPPVRLAALVRRIEGIPALCRIRISSLDPNGVDRDLFDAIITGKKICHSLHLSLQSGSDLILKRMGRKYSREEFLKTVRRLVEADPEFTFITDVIVGFPGEGESEFRETLDIIEEVQFAKVHVFPYSDRPRTRASRMADKIPEELIRERMRRALELAEKVAFAKRERYKGREIEVLLEGRREKKEGYFMGYTPHFFPVFVRGKGLRPNRLIRAVCTGNEREGLIADGDLHLP